MGQSRNGVARKGVVAVAFAEVRCVIATLWMLARDRLKMPQQSVGRLVRFADGTRSKIYRETAIRERSYDDLVLIVVRFRLRWIGVSHFWHAVFRLESLLNTLLFAAHPGFQTKLWLTDRDTGFYRGIYEWQGRVASVEYAETLRMVLAPWVEAGSFGYQVLDHRDRDGFLRGDPNGSRSDLDAWWRPVAPAEAVAE